MRSLFFKDEPKDQRRDVQDDWKYGLPGTLIIVFVGGLTIIAALILS